MTNTQPPLMAALQVEQLDKYLFRGITPKPSMPRIFGGQVMAQAMNAAVRTVDEGRNLHSFHSYFLRPGNPQQPIIFDVDPIRDGGSFSTRRVVAKQDGKAIYNCALSFMAESGGFSHQQPMPDAVAPETLESEVEINARLAEKYPGRANPIASFPDWDMRWVAPFDPFDHQARSPVIEIWMRFKPILADSALAHKTLLAYASDFGLMAAATLPHDINPASGDVQMASLDHGMWFHQSCNVNEWIYYRAEGHWAGNGRGLNIGKLYRRDGTLVATTVQEGLMRVFDSRDSWSAKRGDRQI